LLLRVCCASLCVSLRTHHLQKAAPDAEQACSSFTGGAAAADADGGVGDAQLDVATAGIGGAADVSALTATGVSVLMRAAGASGSGGGEAAVSMRCGGRRV
jgi:hypothetical protein